MLTSDLAQVRRKGPLLSVAPLKEAARERARELLETYHGIARQHGGATRGELDEALAAVEVEARDRKIAAALAKVVDDQLDFELPAGLDPVELRATLFAAASAARAAGPFDREAVLAAFAAGRELSVADVERALYADLREANRLVAVRPLSAAGVMARWELLQAQAVLLRAVRVTAHVTCRGGTAYRRLFGKLKFLRLLHEIHRQPDESVRIELDGPFSLFEQATRYGLALALALPVLATCDQWSIDATVVWGKARTHALFHLAGKASGEADEPARLADDVQALLDRLRELDSPWRVSVAQALLDLPGVGVCAPDLVFTNPVTGARVYLEMMGHWSRQAVWRRVELVQAGLRERVVFAVGQHLRVSEAALDGELPGAIYVYKRTPVARTVLERVEAVAARDLRT